MLKALENGKHRGLVLVGYSDADRVQWFEDLLTATVFGRLNYLEGALLSDLAAKILGNSASLPVGDFESMQFWPRFALRGSSRSVEPDVVMKFADVILVIEAKRFDGTAMQSPAQLRDELVAVSDDEESSDEGPPRDVVVVAVGGQGGTALALDGPRTISLPWKSLWRCIASLRVESAQSKRIIADIGSALHLAGVTLREPLFLDSLATAALGKDLLQRIMPTESAPSRHLQPFSPAQLQAPLLPRILR